MVKEKKVEDNGTLARPMVLFKNYDYVDNDPNGPGAGIYSGDMDKYKSVSDFRKRKKKRRMRMRKALLTNASVELKVLASSISNRINQIYDQIQKSPNNASLDNKFIKLCEQLAPLLEEIDKNKVVDPTENEVTPITYPPGQVSAVGMFDGIYPQSENEDEPYSDVYYGIQHADDGNKKEKANKKV